MEEGGSTSGKRGRPRIAVTEEVLERRRLARQRANANRPKREGPSRKRGRPRVVLTEEVLEERRLSKQRFNSSRSQRESSRTDPAAVHVSNPGATKEMECSQVTPNAVSEERGILDDGGPSVAEGSGEKGKATLRKRGRPRIVLTEQVLDRRRLSKQRCNARRSKRKPADAEPSSGLASTARAATDSGAGIYT